MPFCRLPIFRYTSGGGGGVREGLTSLSGQLHCWPFFLTRAVRLLGRGGDLIPFGATSENTFDYIMFNKLCLKDLKYNCFFSLSLWPAYNFLLYRVFKGFLVFSCCINFQTNFSLSFTLSCPIWTTGYNVSSKFVASLLSSIYPGQLVGPSIGRWYFRHLVFFQDLFFQTV